MARDNNIYGADDNSFAEKCAADALTPIGGMNSQDLSDYWGKTLDDDAVSRGDGAEKDDKYLPNAMILRKAKAGGGETEALNDSTGGGQRHRRAEGSLGKP